MQIFATLFALTTIVCSTSASPTPLPPGVTKSTSKVTHAALDPVTNRINPVMDPVVGGTIQSAVALLSSVCSDNTSCNTTVSGKIGNMLTNGGDFAGRSSVAGWCSEGHCYGGTQLSGSIPAPFTITCDSVVDSCTGFIYGSINNTFVNGPQIELWGWIAPTGYCANGTCTGSITILGDPAY